MHSIANTSSAHTTRLLNRPAMLAVILGTLFAMALAPVAEASGQRSGAST
ncbi:MAG: hypothetical protein O2800_06510 [Planctomycetota bacterium]|nr:hypothetical protein [Planctomycetota bacterium]